MGDSRPTHIVGKPDDRRSRCGIKDPLPVIWAPFVSAHVEGYGLTLCPDCARTRLTTAARAFAALPPGAYPNTIVGYRANLRAAVAALAQCDQATQ